MVNAAFGVGTATLPPGDAVGPAVAPCTGAHAPATPAMSIDPSRLKLARVSSRMDTKPPTVIPSTVLPAVLNRNRTALGCARTAPDTSSRRHATGGRATRLASAGQPT